MPEEYGGVRGYLEHLFSAHVSKVYVARKIENISSVAVAKILDGTD